MLVCLTTLYNQIDWRIDYFLDLHEANIFVKYFSSKILSQNSFFWPNFDKV